MKQKTLTSRREFVRRTGSAAILANLQSLRCIEIVSRQQEHKPHCTLRIQASAVEIGNKNIVSAVTYNGQFPGPLLRFKEGEPVTIQIYNDTDTPEQLHWHGQTVPTDVDGAAEEGTPYIPAHGSRIITFTPRPAGIRFYHTHHRGGADLHAGQYSGQVGPVYIESKDHPGDFDREVFSYPQGIRAVTKPGRRYAARLSCTRHGSERVA